MDARHNARNTQFLNSCFNRCFNHGMKISLNHRYCEIDKWKFFAQFSMVLMNIFGKPHWYLVHRCILFLLILMLTVWFHSLRIFHSFIFKATVVTNVNFSWRLRTFEVLKALARYIPVCKNIEILLWHRR